MPPAWEEVDHTADWALKAWGHDLRALFENAARGMAALIGGEARPGQESTHRQFNLSAPDLETLLVDWLTALLILVEDEGAFFEAIEVQEVARASLRGRVSYRPGGQFTKHIKAVTFHNLAVRQTAEGYETVIVFDV